MLCGFLIIIQLVLIQNAFSKEITQLNKDTNIQYYDQPNDFIYELMPIENNERGLIDIWNNIKNSAKNAWNSLKNLAQHTKQKINIWVQNVKNRAVAITVAFKERVNELKSKITNIIQQIADNESIKKCFQDEAENINKILLDIVKKVTACISNKIGGLAALEDNNELDTKLNDSEFMEKIDASLNKCKENKEEMEHCLEGVREYIINETDAIEDELLKSRDISRGFADDILDAVITCSTNGLVEASAVIVNEVLVIIKCITQESS